MKGCRKCKEQSDNLNFQYVLPVFVGLQLKGKYPLMAPQQSPVQPAGTVVSQTLYSGQLTVEIRGDAPFEEHCLGCRVLELPALSLQNIPKRWRLPESEWSEAEEVPGAPGNDNMPADPLAVAALCNGESDNRTIS
jgi:hypothetical protein